MKFKVIAILFVLFILLLSQYKFLLAAYARFFIVDNPTIGAEAAIVVLSGGARTRIPKALELYQQGYGTRVLLTKTRPLNSKMSHAFSKVYMSYEEGAQLTAKILNIPVKFESVPSLKGGATSTFDEALDLLRFCLKQKLKHLIIVTDEFHSRRALYAFNKVFRGNNIKIEVSAARNEVFNSTNWWHSDIGISAYILEPIKFFVYLFQDENVSFIRNY